MFSSGWITLWRLPHFNPFCSILKNVPPFSLCILFYKKVSSIPFQPPPIPPPGEGSIPLNIFVFYLDVCSHKTFISRKFLLPTQIKSLGSFFKQKTGGGIADRMRRGIERENGEKKIIWREKGWGLTMLWSIYNFWHF